MDSTLFFCCRFPIRLRQGRHPHSGSLSGYDSRPAMTFFFFKRKFPILPSFYRVFRGQAASAAPSGCSGSSCGATAGMGRKSKVSFFFLSLSLVAQLIFLQKADWFRDGRAVQVAKLTVLSWWSTFRSTCVGELRFWLVPHKTLWFLLDCIFPSWFTLDNQIIARLFSYFYPKSTNIILMHIFTQVFSGVLILN